MGADLLEAAIADARAAADNAGEEVERELPLLIGDLEEARLTVFVKTAEAKPLLERCERAARALKEAVEAEATWGDKARDAFASLERAVSKLRNTILVRTQRAT
ncbi:MAG: hypothetical protein JRJ26_20595 [Deltaproteobacteria bacterium]|nr:hypothetical protein [Deltaproteobacteria bacterium]